MTKTTNTENKLGDKNSGDYIFPREKSHWDKYQFYYLIFGCFFFTLIITLISNFSIDNRIRKINQQSDEGFRPDIKFSSPKMSDYFSRLEKEPFPEHVKKSVSEEISKICNNSMHGFEKEIKQEWVNQVMKFPWYQTVAEKDNIVEVEKSLNERHFGMEKVKKLIIEHLATKKQAGKNFGKVLCLVGPPGVGKTSIARSIAEALGRPYEKISLGGVHDEGEIRGHRNTYVGAKPGVIVQACQRAKVKNSVINLDEIDKMGESQHHGNPAAAFLEILDAEQNEFFRDHYIELEADLSQVMFICTANQIENIPRPLRDRMQVIEIPSYTATDKKLIVKNFLIPKLLTKFKLTKEQLTFEDEAIQSIITNYTREAGIRNLETKLESIFSTFITKSIKGGLKSENITAEKVRDYLGKPENHDLTFEANYLYSGVVNGLSVNKEIGEGNVLPIEVRIIPSGKREIIITGNLKETMEQSAKVALSYVQANSQFFNIRPENVDFTKKTLHIHIPKGGIPKDGPSAGIALTTAILSALTEKKINRKVGMTGEITLYGKVSEIGGLREKITAAHRRGLKTVFIPKSNEKDIEDIPAEIQDELAIISVSNYQEVWNKIEELNLIE